MDYKAGGTIEKCISWRLIFSWKKIHFRNTSYFFLPNPRIFFNSEYSRQPWALKWNHNLILKIKAIVFTVGYSSFRQRATMAALPEKWLVFKLFYTVFKPLLQTVVNLERINTKFRSNGGTQYRPDRSCTSAMCAFDSGVKL